MKNRSIPTAVATSLILLSGLASSVSGQSTITGKISNGTAGGSVPPQMVITAAGLKEDGTEASRSQSTAAPDGSFTLEAPEGSTRVVVATDYLGVTYSTVVDSGTDVVELVVFETTRDGSEINVTSDTITIVSGADGTMEVFQLIRFRNSGDRTYIGHELEGLPSVLELPTPQGAFDLVPGQGITARNVREIPGGFSTSDPVLPGTTSVNFLYKVRVARSGWPLVRQVFYQTDHIDVLIGPGLEISGSGLEFEESVELGGRSYRRYRSGPHNTGAVFEAGVAFSGSSSGGLIPGVVAGLAVILLASFLVRKFRVTSKRKTGAGPSEREVLVLEIAALDEEFASGAIPEDAYQANRGELKKKLEEIASNMAASAK